MTIFLLQEGKMLKFITFIGSIDPHSMYVVFTTKGKM